jgi:hypothetical protein
LAQRADGDLSQNWELAIAAFEDALSVWMREHNPQQWTAPARDRDAVKRTPRSLAGAGECERRSRQPARDALGRVLAAAASASL